MITEITIANVIKGVSGLNSLITIPVSGSVKNDTTAALIEQQVKLNPNNIAVICEDKSITYKELDEKANSLAHEISKKITELLKK